MTHETAQAGSNRQIAPRPDSGQMPYEVRFASANDLEEKWRKIDEIRVGA